VLLPVGLLALLERITFFEKCAQIIDRRQRRRLRRLEPVTRGTTQPIAQGQTFMRRGSSKGIALDLGRGVISPAPSGAPDER